MSEYRRARANGSPDTSRGPAAASATSAEDELALRITRALQARGGAHPDASVVAARIEAQLGDAPAVSSLSTFRRRGGRIVVAGVVTSAIAVAGAGAAAASNPYSEVARAVENVAQAVGVDWSFMPSGYTREQYEAFWGAGHTVEDVDALGALWNLGTTETKAKAGQMLIDGEALPLEGVRTPVELDGTGTPVDADDPRDAFWDAGYTYDDAVALSELWSTDVYETKATAGQMILDGQELPLRPGSAPAPTATGDVPGDAPTRAPQEQPGASGGR